MSFLENQVRQSLLFMDNYPKPDDHSSRLGRMTYQDRRPPQIRWPFQWARSVDFSGWMTTPGRTITPTDQVGWLFQVTGLDDYSRRSGRTGIPEDLFSSLYQLHKNNRKIFSLLTHIFSIIIIVIYYDVYLSRIVNRVIYKYILLKNKKLSEYCLNLSIPIKSFCYMVSEHTCVVFHF